MQVYSWNIGILGSMAKGKMPYDAKLASTLANNLSLVAQMNNGRAWPKGSDNQALLVPTPPSA